MNFTLRADDGKTATLDITTVSEGPPMKVELAGTVLFDRATGDSLGMTQEGKVTGPMPGVRSVALSFVRRETGRAVTWPAGGR
jgi:hypothetical protein